MRATATPSPNRNGKRRLFESCAIAAGLMALAYGGPALAQVAGSGTITNLPGGTTGNTGANPSTVNVTGSQNIVTWTPSNAPVDGVIDFLPSGNTLNFVGNTPGYIVLNRFTSAAGTSITDQIALNGTVNSYVGATTGPRGGNIWFQNAGGVLIGSSGVINVGSLVLTSNDIDTTGGLLGPGNTIRFRGAPGSTASVSVLGAINANNVGNPGSSYVALVAPRVVQAGAVTVDGSAAYVAAEQADIRINNGLFDINVLVGAEGGNVITHTGTTTGPAHQQGDVDQSRIYMVAIPKNDAVTMLVSGQIGYDDALSAQVDPDGAVRLSAGYNITGGELDAAPVNATAANISITDTLFRSDTVARASGALVGQPVQVLPPPVLPFAPPPQQGRILVQGNGTFIGDASATFNVNAGRAVGATGNFTVQSGGTNGAPGNASVNVNGGQFGVGGNLTISANGTVDAATGDSIGGAARLNVNSGGLAAIGGTATVAANGTAGIDTGGNGGDGRGGTADASVSGAGSVLSASALITTAIGTGGGVTTDPVSGTTVADVGGNGFGGTATVLVENGGSLSTSIGVAAAANGQGQIGTSQSGDGQGGTASIGVTGAASSFQAPTTIVLAAGNGGGNISGPLGTFTTLAGGDGVGGQASITIGADASSTVDFGNTSIGATGDGGGAAGENSAGGQGEGGTASIAGTGGGTAQFNDVTIDTSGTGGGATSPSGQTASSGDAVGGVINVTATVGTTLAIGANLVLTATGVSATADNIGSGEGGDVTVAVESGGSINVSDLLIVDASGGSFGPAVFAQNAGSGTGGNVDLTAIGSGAIRADGYLVNAGAGVVNVSGASGAAQGGSIDVAASTGGQILVTNDSNNFFDTSAFTGVSAAGSSATGGTVQLIANGGTIDMGVGASLAAGGVSGGAINPGPNNPIGRGGTILVQLVAEPTGTSAINLGDFDAAADGLTAVDVEGSPLIPDETAGSGQGGDIVIDMQGGTLTAASINASANGFGGGTAGGAGGALGSGGTATFTQTGGTVNVGDMTISADGFGGTAPGQSGAGQGGTATINLNGGTITAADIVATADGLGGDGSSGNDDDPANVVPGGLGGAGQGGAATINIGGTAVVDASIILAQATGTGGAGGEFFNASSFGGSPGTPGNGGGGTGGNATVNVTGGTTTASSMIADASGIGGGGGGSFFSSSSGGATSVGVGGTGGTGQGGAATIALESAITGVGTTSSIAQGTGGAGGDHNVGGAGGEGFGGLAQAIVTDFDAGQLAVTLDSSGTGGNGGNGRDGAGGNGGGGGGGVSRLAAEGAGSLTAVETNFITSGTGGNGGNGQLGFGSFELVAPSGGNGGDGRGGTIEIAANGGGTVTLGLVAGDTVILGSTGTGGNGGSGSDSVFDANAVAGNGGIGGGGSGGTVRLVTNGGTISSNGEAVAINAGGVSGTGGAGGNGNGGGTAGANGGSFGTAGGRVAIEAFNGLTGPGAITLGNTEINANGGTAGRIELRAEGNISFAGLDAEAAGFALPTNNDTDVAPAGIFFAMNGGTISSQGDASLTTGSSFGAYAQSDGIFDVGGALTINAVDQIDIRHDFREGAAPTIRAGDGLTATAGGISGGPGSLLASGGTLSLTSTLGAVGVGGLDAVDITIDAAGAASVEHAEADNDFTATGTSFRTGLNSIITGGDISVTSPGTIDLGNSTAGGSVFAEGQSIAFAAIDAGTVVTLRAQGFGPVDGVNGDSIVAGGNIALTGRGITVDNIQTTGSLSASASNGPATLGSVETDGNISVSASGNVIGTFTAGGNINLRSTADIIASANATGGYIDASTGFVSEGTVFADADGDANVAGGAATMFGVRAGGSATLDTVTAGEDVFVLAGTTANLTGVTAGDDLYARADGGITVQSSQTTGTGPDGRSIVYQACCSNPSPFLQIQTSAADLSNVTLLAPTSTINATDVAAFDNFTATAGGTVTAGGLIRSGLATTISGSDLSLAAITAGTDIALTASSDGVSATGAIAAGHDVTVTAAGAVNVSEFDAGDDIRVNAGGALTVGGAYSYGTGLDNEGDGSNIVLSAGDTDVTHAEADNDFIADVASFTTGLDSIITGGDIIVTSAGAVDMGNSTAGGFVSVTGQSVAFNMIDAGGSVSLSANDDVPDALGINGGTIDAGGDVDLNAARIAITGTVSGTGSLFANSFTGPIAINLADFDDSISISSSGNITGTYNSGGNIRLNSGASINATANAIGSQSSSSGPPMAASVFADAAENVVLTNSGASGMFGVNAGGSATLTGITAGEDLLVRAQTTATIANATAGDDLTVDARAITASGLVTTGTGPDTRRLFYNTGPFAPTGFAVTTTAPNGSNIELAAWAGGATVNSANAFGNLTIGASTAATSTGALQSGGATSVMANVLTLTSITAGTDIVLGAGSGSISATGALIAGNDINIVASGAIDLFELHAGDDIQVDGGNPLTIGGAYSRGTGVDDEGNGSNIMLTSEDINIARVEADNDFVAIASSGGIVDLGDATIGGDFAVAGGSIMFDSIVAGSGGGLYGVDTIDGGSIDAGGSITVEAANVAIGAVSGDAGLLVLGGNTVAINQADVAGNIAITAGGNLSGTYVAGGNISLTSDANINASATAGGTTADGNLFIDAGGNVVLANSTAARMFGVNAGGSAAITGGTAGEDLLVRTGTTASLTNVTAGDDVDIRAGGNVTANNVSATGTGADTRLLSYMPGSGFTIMQGEGTSSVDGSDVRIASTNGAINAATLSAGDDISLVATGGNATLGNATTLGLGVTGGSSDISVEAAGATLAGLNSAGDVLVTTSGATNVDGTIVADRDIAITAGAVNLATLATPGGNPVDTLAAGRNIGVVAADDISGGRINAVGDITLTSGGAIEVGGIFGNNVAVDGATGITADQLFAVGTTTLNSDNGAIALNTLVSSGNVDASADSIVINGGSMIFSNIVTDVGDAIVRGGDLFIVNGNIAGRAEFSSSGERLGVTTLTAQSAALEASGGFMTLDNVDVSGALSATARTSLGITGVVTGQSISLASANIDIAPTGRVGTAGTTGEVSIANNNPDNQTFVGGTGTPNGYHIDASELTRVFGSDVEIFAPEVQAAGGGSVGSAAPPDVIVDSFTMTGGASGSNLGASGQLTIRTPGKMRVTGNVQLTGLTDANALNLFADDALEVILGQGSVRLINGNAPAGQLNMASDDIIVATADAIADVGAATTTDAIETRLAQNDGVLLDEGALFARGIRAEVVGGFYVQNSGAGTRFAERRGMTFGAGGLDVLTEGPSRIVINGVHLGPNGQVTGLDTIPLLTIAGSVPAPGSFDPRSTFNGCLITGAAACNAPTGNSFPVQDVIEEESEGDKGDGNNLPQPLITMRDLDPLSGEPLLDDPVTGAGNDDLWTPEFDSCDPGSASGGTCPAAE